MENKVAVMPVAPLGVNCIFLTNNKKQLVIVDPGGDADRIVDYIDEQQLVPAYIFLTHGHFDHVGAVSDLATRFKIPVYAHAQDSATISNAHIQSRSFGIDIDRVEVTEHFEDGQIIPFGEYEIRVIHTPGHSAGCVCFYIPQLSLLISGDTLFRDGIGRTDFPGSSTKAILHSIQPKLFTLPDETVVIPGHGETTTIGHEAETNLYVIRQGE